MKKFLLNRGRSGIALILVVSVLAFAAIVGFAMLSTASMQAQTTYNSNLALSADALAESGVDLACYYLINPSKAPEPVPVGGFYDGGTISFGPNMPGSVELAITALPNPGDYKIVSIGKAGPKELAHTVTATVRISPGYQVKSPVGFWKTGFLPLTATINGDVQSNELLNNLGVINGKVISPLAVIGTGTILDGLLSPTPGNTMIIPPLPNLRDYSTYTYRGATYSATLITGLPTGTTLGPTANNPAGIYRYNGAALSMNHNVTINGTLIVETDLNISGGGNVINPEEGFPALITKGNVWVRGPALPSPSPRDLTAHGITWVGGALKASGYMANAGVTFNGALLFGGTGNIDLLFGARLTVNVNANKVAGVNLDTTIAPAGAKVLSYKQ